MATRSTSSGKSTSRNTKKGATKTNTKRGNTKSKKKDIANLVTVDDSIRDEAVLLCILGVSILIYLALFAMNHLVVFLIFFQLHQILDFLFLFQFE